MQSNKTCSLLEQYLDYLMVIKGRSLNTILEYRTDIISFLTFVLKSKSIPLENSNFNFVDINFIKSITLEDMYSYISYCKLERKVCAGTIARKIVSIRQFWKYLKTKVHLIDNNIAEELETPNLPKRIPVYLSLEESVRLLIITNVTS